MSEFDVGIMYLGTRDDDDDEGKGQVTGFRRTRGRRDTLIN
jgi:hypothetical protein